MSASKTCQKNSHILIFTRSAYLITDFSRLVLFQAEGHFLEQVESKQLQICHWSCMWKCIWFSIRLWVTNFLISYKKHMVYASISVIMNSLPSKENDHPLHFLSLTKKPDQSLHSLELVKSPGLTKAFFVTKPLHHSLNHNSFNCSCHLCKTHHGLSTVPSPIGVQIVSVTWLQPLRPF